jgi:hypothetical protein
MTKYILNSGGIKNSLKFKRLFHEEIIKNLGSEPKILLCNFAQGREYWEVKFPAYVEAILEDMPDGVRPAFELAMPDTFVAQIKEADAIYFHGGDGDLLHYWMGKYKLPELFKDKVVATNSASSDMLAVSFWTCDWRSCADGFGILPIKFIPHFESQFGSNDPRGPVDWHKAYNELKVYGDTALPIYALKEGEFEVFEVNE